MNPKEPSAEDTLRSALALPPTPPASDSSERLVRVKSALHVQTAARDACHFLIDGVTIVLGWMILTLLSFFVPDAKLPESPNTKRDEHD